MQITYIRNGSPRLLITPESSIEEELLAELEGAAVTILPESASLIGEQVGRSLQIKHAGPVEPKKKSIIQKIFS